LSPATLRGLTLDTGALLALDQPSKATIMQARVEEVRRRGASICIPVGTIAQAWRGPRQVRLARLIKSTGVDISVMTLTAARAVGLLCAQSGHGDIVDAHVALCARERGHAIVTSDTDDITRIDPGLALIPV
jgi:predicted nucleic acid-binding protein